MFDLSRDVLLTTEQEDTLNVLAAYIARRFELTSVALCLPTPDGRWILRQGGWREVMVSESELSLSLAKAGAALEFDARERTYGG